METALQLTQEQSQVIAQKREAWAQMGEAVYRSELQLQIQAQAALADIELPTTIEQVPVAEDRLKNIKSSLAAITNNRKAVTSKFDDVTARLMVPEKSFAEPIKMLSDAIIGVKQAYEAESKKKQARFDEIKRCQDHYRNEKIRVEAELAAKVNALVTRCYEHALNKDVKAADVVAYLNTAKASVTADQFPVQVRTFTPVILTAEECQAVCQDLAKIDQQQFADLFARDVDAKFSDYAVAIANKEQALQLAAEEEKRKATEIGQQQQQQQVAAKLESAATSVNVEPVITKVLKKSYEVDMPDTVESILAVMGAFSANIHLCMPKLKVTKWWSFTPLQAAAALGKVKSDDNQFAPAGITFKVVSKL